MFNLFCAVGALSMLSYFLVKIRYLLTEWPHIGKIGAHSAYGMFSWYKYLIVNLLFFQSRFLEWESFSDCIFF